MTSRSIDEAIHAFWDCIIVGAGPAGCHAGYMLAKQDWKVLILERANQPGATNACGGAIIALLKQKLEIETIIDKKCYGVKIRYKNKTSCHKSRFPVTLMIRRSILDNHLAMKAQQAGAEVLCGVSVRSINESPLAVKCVSSHSVKDIIIKGKCLVLADGPTTIGNSINLGFNKQHQLFIPAIKTDVEVDEQQDSIEFIVESDFLYAGYCWVFPKSKILNIGIGGITLMKNAKLHSVLDSFLHNYFGGKQVKKLNIKGGIVPLETAKKFATRNVLVIGDAAGLVNPVTGGGIHYAIKSAEIAADLIDKKLAAKPEMDLRSYNTLIKLNAYYPWLKIMRIALNVLLKSGKYRSSGYYYFMKCYFFVLAMLSNLLYVLQKIINIAGGKRVRNEKGN